MKWRPFKGGVPYTCQECPAFVDMRDDRDRWERAATVLIAECGHDSHCPTFLVSPDEPCECGFDKPLTLYMKAVRGE